MRYRDQRECRPFSIIMFYGYHWYFVLKNTQIKYWNSNWIQHYLDFNPCHTHQLCVKLCNVVETAPPPTTGWPKYKFVKSNGSNSENIHFDPMLENQTSLPNTLWLSTMGSKMHIFRVIVIWISNLWFGSPCTATTIPFCVFENSLFGALLRNLYQCTQQKFCLKVQSYMHPS